MALGHGLSLAVYDLVLGDQRRWVVGRSVRVQKRRWLGCELWIGWFRFETHALAGELLPRREVHVPADP